MGLLCKIRVQNIYQKRNNKTIKITIKNLTMCVKFGDKALIH